MPKRAALLTVALTGKGALRGVWGDSGTGFLAVKKEAEAEAVEVEADGSSACHGGEENEGPDESFLDLEQAEKTPTWVAAVKRRLTCGGSGADDGSSSAPVNGASETVTESSKQHSLAEIEPTVLMLIKMPPDLASIQDFWTSLARANGEASCGKPDGHCYSAAEEMDADGDRIINGELPGKSQYVLLRLPQKELTIPSELNSLFGRLYGKHKLAFNRQHMTSDGPKEQRDGEHSEVKAFLRALGTKDSAASLRFTKTWIRNKGKLPQIEAKNFQKWEIPVLPPAGAEPPNASTTEKAALPAIPDPAEAEVGPEATGTGGKENDSKQAALATPDGGSPKAELQKEVSAAGEAEGPRATGGKENDSKQAALATPDGGSPKAELQKEVSAAGEAEGNAAGRQQTAVTRHRSASVQVAEDGRGVFSMQISNANEEFCTEEQDTSTPGCIDSAREIDVESEDWINRGDSYYVLLRTLGKDAALPKNVEDLFSFLKKKNKKNKNLVAERTVMKNTDANQKDSVNAFLNAVETKKLDASLTFPKWENESEDSASGPTIHAHNFPCCIL
eukprot:CAMPEP_0178985132 /NCGR_PEP_ID=MMETSP0795-20121207/1986_1 /TAXON_ID=88552 /ORGANISM="Amoebophrya sp., Strain Ameob2" /LENGTH=561 /DNA_ID=CAMNT_0020676063 /DNA_START=1 /DNA_END=1686 /DNA_ORIENTATION=+